MKVPDKLDHPEFIRYFHNLLVDVWRTGEVPQQWKDATIKVLYKRKVALTATTSEGFRLLPTQASIAENGRVPPQQLLRGRRDTPRRTVRLSPRAINSGHAVRRGPTARTRMS